MTRLIILFTLFIIDTKLVGQRLQLISLSESSQYKSIEKRTIKKATKFYKSMYSKFPKDREFMIVPSINITVDKDSKVSKGIDQFSLAFTDSKVAPFMIIETSNGKYKSIIDLVNGELYSLPNWDVTTNQSLPTDNISLKVEKYGRMLSLINNYKADNAFLVNNVDNCWIILSGKDIHIVDVKLFQVHDMDWLLTKLITPNN